MPLRHSLRHIEDGIDKPSHILQLVLFKIILGNGDIGLYYFTVRRIFPRCQSHMFLLRIGSLHNQFSCGVSMHCIVHLILHLFEEKPRGRCITVIVYRCGVYIRQLLIETAFTQTYLPNLSQQMLEIVLSDKRTVLHPLLINHISPNGKLTQYESTPLPELGSSCAIHPITHRYNGIKIIEFEIAIYLTLTFGLNYREILGSCLL